MSTNLYWRPLKAGGSLSDGLKYILKSEGYFNREDRFQLTDNDLTLLKGVRAGSKDNRVIDDLTDLIVQLENGEVIEIYLY